MSEQDDIRLPTQPQPAQGQGVHPWGSYNSADMHAYARAAVSLNTAPLRERIAELELQAVGSSAVASEETRKTVALTAERDELRAELDALRKQEPVAWLLPEARAVESFTTHRIGMGPMVRVGKDKPVIGAPWSPLHAQPMPPAPRARLTDEQVYRIAIDFSYGLVPHPSLLRNVKKVVRLAEDAIEAAVLGLQGEKSEHQR